MTPIPRCAAAGADNDLDGFNLYDVTLAGHRAPPRRPAVRTGRAERLLMSSRRTAPVSGLLLCGATRTDWRATRALITHGYLIDKSPAED